MGVPVAVPLGLEPGAPAKKLLPPCPTQVGQFALVEAHGPIQARKCSIWRGRMAVEGSRTAIEDDSSII